MEIVSPLRGAPKTLRQLGSLKLTIALDGGGVLEQASVLGCVAAARLLNDREQPFSLNREARACMGVQGAPSLCKGWKGHAHIGARLRAENTRAAHK